MTTVRQISFNTLYQIVAKAVTTASTVLVTFLLTKTFGEAGYGEFTIAMAYSALFYLAVDFGLNAISTKELASDESKLSYYFRTILSLRVVWASCIFGLALIPLLFLPYAPSLKLAVFLSCFTILTQALVSCAGVVYQFKLRYDLAAIADILSAATILGLAYGVSRYGGTVPTIVFVFVLGNIVRVLVGFWLIRGYLHNIRFHVDPIVWKRLMLLALPIGLAGFFGQINSNADKLIISLSSFPDGMQPVVAAGVYGLAYKIFEVSLVVPTFFTNAAYPVMVRHLHMSAGKLLSTVKRMYLAMLLLSVGATICGIVLVPYVIQLFKGAQGGFEESIQIVRVLLLGLPIFYLSAISMWTVIAVGRQKTLIWIYAGAALLNILLNGLFIPMYGILAPAVITIVSELFIISLTTTIGLRELRRLVHSEKQ